MAIPKYEEALKNAIRNNDWTVCGPENYGGHMTRFRDRVDCMKKISKAIAAGRIEEFSPIEKFKRLMEDSYTLDIVDKYEYEEPLLERVIRHKPEFLKALLERSCSVSNFFYLQHLVKNSYESHGDEISNILNTMPEAGLIQAIKEDDRVEVADIITKSQMNTGFGLTAYSPAKRMHNLLTDAEYIHLLWKLALQNGSYNVLPYLLDLGRVVSAEPVYKGPHARAKYQTQAENLEREVMGHNRLNIPRWTDRKVRKLSTLIKKHEYMALGELLAKPEMPEVVAKNLYTIVCNDLTYALPQIKECLNVEDELGKVLANKKVKDKDVKQFFALLKVAGAHIIDLNNRAPEFVKEHSLALLKLSVKHGKYTLLDPLLQIDGVRQVALNNIDEICREESDSKSRPDLERLINGQNEFEQTPMTSTEVKAETGEAGTHENTKKRKFFAFNSLKNLKGFKGFTRGKGRLCAPKSLLRSRLGAVADRLRAATTRSKKSASSSPPGSHGPGNS